MDITVQHFAAFLAGVVLVSALWLGNWIGNVIDDKHKWQQEIYQFIERPNTRHKKR